MAEEEIILIWLGIVSIIGLNGFAAGVMALMHRRSRPARKVANIAIATAFSGFLPASVFLPMALTDREFVLGDGPLITAFAFVAVLGVGMLISLPGALVMARKLGAPTDEFHVFE